MKKRGFHIPYPQTGWQVFLLFLAVNFCAAFWQGTANTDEIWNFTFGMQVSSGRLPYRDFNMLQTPLSAWINGLILLVFGRHLLVERISGAVLFSLVGLKMRSISLNLGASKVESLVPGLIFAGLMCTNVFLEYSCLILLFQLCIMEADMKMMKEKHSSAEMLFTGILCGLSILSKQTTGVFLSASALVTAWLIGRTYGQPGKTAGMRLAGMLLVLTGFACYLIATRTMDDFLDYCFYGISAFTARGSYAWYLGTDPGNCVHGILMPVPFLYHIFETVQCRKKQEGKSLFCLLILSCGGLINLVPITNYYHLSVSLAPSLCFVPLMLRKPDECLFHGRFLSALMKAAPLCCLIFSLSGYWMIASAKDMHILKGWKHLEGIASEPALKDELEMTSPLIQKAAAEGREFYMLDNTAEYCLLPHDLYHKDLDMFLYGNLGTRSAAECLDQSLQEGAYYLIADRNRNNTQFPAAEIRTFTGKLTKVSEMDGFILYQYR